MEIFQRHTKNRALAEISNAASGIISKMEANVANFVEKRAALENDGMGKE